MSTNERAAKFFAQSFPASSATDAAGQSARREALEEAITVCQRVSDAEAVLGEYGPDYWTGIHCAIVAIRSLASSIEARERLQRRGPQTAVPCAANIVAQSKLKALLREMSDVLLTLRPMGGSEMLKRVYIDGQEEYYADAHYCARLIEQMRADWREVRIPRATTKSIEPQVPVAHVDEVCEPGTVKSPPPQDGVTELPSEETLAMIEKLDFEIAELDGQIIELRNRDQTPVEAAILVVAKRTRELLSEAHAILTATPGLINHSAMRR